MQYCQNIINVKNILLYIKHSLSVAALDPIHPVCKWDSVCSVLSVIFTIITICHLG